MCKRPEEGGANKSKPPMVKGRSDGAIAFLSQTAASLEK